jgi:hypothetical protein
MRAIRTAQYCTKSPRAYHDVLVWTAARNVAEDLGLHGYAPPDPGRDAAE